MKQYKSADEDPTLWSLLDNDMGLSKAKEGLLGAWDGFNEYADTFNAGKDILLNMPFTNIPKAELQENPSLWNLIARDAQNNGNMQGDISYGDVGRAAAEVFPPTETAMDLLNFGEAAYEGDKIGMAIEGANLLLPRGLEMAVGMGMLGGSKAKNLKPEVKKLAEEMNAAGADRDEIWKATGELGQPAFFDPVDGSFRFEMDDSGTAVQGTEFLQPEFKDGARVKNAPAMDAGVWMQSHPAYDAYPEMEKTLMQPTESILSSGYYMPSSDTMGISAFAENPRSTTLHEMQHNIQSREGWASGGDTRTMKPLRNHMWDDYPEDVKRFNELKDSGIYTEQLDIGNQKYNDDIKPAINDLVDSFTAGDISGEELLVARQGLLDDFSAWSDVETPVLKEVDSLSNMLGKEYMSVDDQYRRLLGEVDSRAVQKRMDMPMSERLNTPFWESYDESESEFIRKYRGGASNSENDGTLSLIHNLTGNNLRHAENLGYGLEGQEDPYAWAGL